MSVREAMGKRPVIMKAGAISLFVVACGLLMYQASRLSKPQGAQPFSKSFFSNDDGATFFADDLKKVAPFDKDGKPAYRAYVFTADGGKTKFVGYLQRVNESAKAAAEKAKKDPAFAGDQLAIVTIMNEGQELKKPGPGNQWTSAHNVAEVRNIINVKGPNGADVETVDP